MSYHCKFKDQTKSFLLCSFTSYFIIMLQSFIFPLGLQNFDSTPIAEIPLSTQYVKLPCLENKIRRHFSRLALCSIFCMQPNITTVTGTWVGFSRLGLGGTAGGVFDLSRTPSLSIPSNFDPKKEIKIKLHFGISGFELKVRCRSA